eukprot:7551613-Pyramimonas_sp.AAC.1
MGAPKAEHISKLTSAFSTLASLGEDHRGASLIIWRKNHARDLKKHREWTSERWRGVASRVPWVSCGLLVGFDGSAADGVALPHQRYHWTSWGLRVGFLVEGFSWTDLHRPQLRVRCASVRAPAGRTS